MQIEITDEKVLVKRPRDTYSNSETIYKINLINLININYLLSKKYYRNTFYPIRSIPNCREIIYRYISIISNRSNKIWLYFYFLFKKGINNIIFQLPYKYQFFLEPTNNYIQSNTCIFCNDKNDDCRECGGLETNVSYVSSSLSDDSCKCSNMTENDYCPFHRITQFRCMKRRVVRCAPYNHPFTPEIESRKKYEYQNPNAYRILLDSDLFVCVTDRFKNDGIFTVSRENKNILIDDLYITINDIRKLFNLLEQSNGQYNDQ